MHLLFMTNSEIRQILSTKKFKSLTYRKLNGSIHNYHAAQLGVHRELIKGAPPPSEYKSWKLYWEKTNTINLWCRKEGEEAAKFRSLKLDGIISVRAEGSIFE